VSIESMEDGSSLSTRKFAMAAMAVATRHQSDNFSHWPRRIGSVGD
jgi:hypothetical protein